MGVWPSNMWSALCCFSRNTVGSLGIETPVYLMSQQNPKYVLSVVVPYNFLNTKMLLGLPTRPQHQLFCCGDLMSFFRFERWSLWFCVPEWMPWVIRTWSTKHLSRAPRSVAVSLRKPESRRWSALLETLLIFPESVSKQRWYIPKLLGCKNALLSSCHEWSNRIYASQPVYYCCLLQKKMSRLMWI